MILDKWLGGDTTSIYDVKGSIFPDVIDKALDELEGEAGKIMNLVQTGKYWDAYVRLTACVTFLNMASQQYPHKQPAIIQRLLNWIQKIKSAVDKIVKGIGGNGYSIGISAPFGVSISISFTA